MVGVLTLFGESDLQPVLKKVFSQKQIYFIQDNCNTSVQLLSQLDEHGKESDVVIINANCINKDSFNELVETIRNVEKQMRIILVLNGKQSDYLREVLNEYKSQNIDLVFDDNGFQVDTLIGIVEKGKLSHKETRVKRRESGFDEDLDIGDKIAENNKPENTRKSRIKEKEVNIRKPSYSNIKGHYVISVINASRGAGATKTVFDLARYFALHNFKSCVIDCSSTRAISTIKIKNISVFDGRNFCIESDANKEYNAIIYDFGTPLNISPDGTGYQVADTVINKLFDFEFVNKSTIKIFTGLTDSWNIERIKFILKYENFNKYYDNSYLFIVPENAEKLRREFPQYNIINRSEDFRELIMEVIRREEANDENIPE